MLKGKQTRDTDGGLTFTSRRRQITVDTDGLRSTLTESTNNSKTTNLLDWYCLSDVRLTYITRTRIFDFMQGRLTLSKPFYLKFLGFEIGDSLI